MRALLVIAVLLTVAWPGAGAAQGQLPDLSAVDLVGTERTLPGALGGQVNLLIMAFERNQDDVVATWREAAARLRVESPSLDYYGVPVLPRGLSWMRSLIASGLRDDYPSRQDQEHVLMVFTSGSRLRTALGVGRGEGVRAVLVDDAGVVLWWSQGPADGAREAELGGAVRAALRTISAE